MGFLIEIVVRIFVSVLNQFTKKDLNAFIEQFPKEVGQKIGEAVKGNLAPIKSWLAESSANIKLFVSVLSKKKIPTELYAPDDNLTQIEDLIKAVLDGIDLIKKPIILREIFGNIHYLSLWEIDGYTNNAYTNNGFDITLNSHFRIILIDSNKANYKKLLKLLASSQPLPKKVIKKSLTVKTIHAEGVVVEQGKWIKRRKTIPTNFSTDSYLNLISDIEQNIEHSSNPSGIWNKILQLLRL